ncbi:MAG: hypothetical protein ACFCU6_07020 [Balneolaceae bacterium]
MSNRIFTEDEVKKLIKRAAELEAERSVSGRGSRENGLTIDELKHIASETGLDPELIEQAASEMDTKPNDHKEKVRVNRNEIASEIWLDLKPDRETMDLLVMELNHIYGTTDELNWWDNLWGTHEGKAKVKRTANTTEWNYKTEAGMYSTRVLLQQRGEKFRIRVSKRQIFGMEWHNKLLNFVLVIPVGVALALVGGQISLVTLGNEWPGITAGIVLSLFSYPLIRYLTNRSVEKHRTEVANTMRQLSELVSHSTNLKKSKPSAAKKNKQASAIEIPDEADSSENQPGKLRNNLRE